MNILGVDTTTKNASVVVKTQNGIYVNNDINDITHSEKLLPLIHKTLEESNLSFNDIDLLATTNGPGSFTGCRIGIATIKALSHPRNMQILAVTSLELMASETFLNLTTNKETYICSMLDAKNDRVYYAVYKLYFNTDKIIIENVYDISNDNILKVLDNVSNFSSCIFCGDTIQKFEDEIINYSNTNKLSYTCISNNILPEAKYLINYYEKITDDIISKKMYNTFNLDVIYSRVSQAERMKNGKE